MSTVANISERIDGLERELVALYAKRAGQHEPGQAYGWCAQCGRNPVYPGLGEATCRSCVSAAGRVRLATQ